MMASNEQTPLINQQGQVRVPIPANPMARQERLTSTSASQEDARWERRMRGFMKLAMQLALITAMILAIALVVIGALTTTQVIARRHVLLVSNYSNATAPLDDLLFVPLDNGTGNATSKTEGAKPSPTVNEPTCTKNALSIDDVEHVERNSSAFNDKDGDANHKVDKDLDPGKAEELSRELDVPVVLKVHIKKRDLYPNSTHEHQH
jgi:hypothetical protein